MKGLPVRIAIASDHAAIAFRRDLAEALRDWGYEVTDFGTDDPSKADYPYYGKLVADSVAAARHDRGIVICGTGVGISIAANKVDAIRCVVCSEPYSAVLSRNHNDTNVLALGARVVGIELAKMIARMWLEAEFEGGRHQRRVNQLMAIQDGVEVEDQVDPGSR